MGTMKLCLFLVFVIFVSAIAAPHSFAFYETSLTHDNSKYGFFDGDSTSATEDSRRQLFQYGTNNKYSRNRYLSYYSLRPSSILCGQHGSSYYDCKKRKKVNPYHRSCTAISKCARIAE
ncbi:Protein RALF-like 4, partial [Cucurbita argyrosperma subsp. argyrosperma]